MGKRNWEKRREGKPWTGCIINKYINLKKKDRNENLKGNFMILGEVIK